MIWYDNTIGILMIFKQPISKILRNLLWIKRSTKNHINKYLQSQEREREREDPAWIKLKRNIYLGEALDLVGRGLVVMSIVRENHGLPFYLLQQSLNQNKFFFSWEKIWLVINVLPSVPSGLGWGNSMCVVSICRFCCTGNGNFEYWIRSASNLKIGGALATILLLRRLLEHDSTIFCYWNSVQQG